VFVDSREPFEVPIVRDFGDLVQMTEANQIQGFEDAGPKFSVLDVSDAVLP
jgi:hypothetical protein